MPADEGYNETTYFCDRCSTQRGLRINKERHQQLVEGSKNGLVLYTDVHICKNGLIAANNLSIDGNYHVRTFELLKLPEYRKPKPLSVPTPGKKNIDNEDQLILTNIAGLEEINMILIDRMLNIRIKFGRFSPQELPILYSLNSDMGGIELQIYHSELSYTDIVEQWLNVLINTLEILPPTELGMLIEAFKYFLDLHNEPPSEFDMRFIKTILASHEIFFELNDVEKIDTFKEEYTSHFDSSDFELIDAFLELLKDKPESPIQDFSREHPKDLTYLIYLFLILEKEELIRIERPGIVSI